MTRLMAIRILMHSPLYFKQNVKHRLGCVKHLVRLANKINNKTR